MMRRDSFYMDVDSLLLCAARYAEFLLCVRVCMCVYVCVLCVYYDSDLSYDSSRFFLCGCGFSASVCG